MITQTVPSLLGSRAAPSRRHAPQTALRRLAAGFPPPAAVLALAAAIWAGGMRASPLAGQEAADGPREDRGWNSPAVLELVERAAAKRLQPVEDSVLPHYTARADGYVYFYVDRGDGSELIPLRVDQVSLDLYWKAPDQARQVVRAQRLEKLMPIKDFRYYLDRLTVIQNGFGDEIRVGEGRDVRGVPHPISRAGPALYDYRITDSLTLILPGDPDPIRVYEVAVRPRDPRAARFIGAVYVDRGSAAIVRMDFTFTPSSYVDRRNERVRVRLEHALWERKVWLPYRQEVEVRRQIPELDLGLASVIRGQLRVGEYDFDTPPPEALFRGPPVMFARDRFQDTTRFRGGLYDGMAEQGLALPGAGAPTLEELEAEVRRLVRDQALSGLPPVRPYVPGVSSILRANRAEGLYAGAGLSAALGGFTRAEAWGGWAFGAEHASLTVGLERLLGTRGASLRLEGYARSPEDIGGLPGASGVVNTGAAVLFGEDYTDLVFRNGVRLAFEGPVAALWTLRVDVRTESQEVREQAWTTAPLADGQRFRPLLPVEEATLSAGRIELERRRLPLAGGEARLTLGGEVGRIEGRTYRRLTGGLTAFRRVAGVRGVARLELQGGWVGGGVPRQRLFLLGGRHVLPGYDYRSFAGRRFVRAGGSYTHTLLPGWVGLRAFGAVAAVGGRDARQVAPWPERTTGGLRAGGGVGLEFVHGTVRIDVGFGERTEWIVSTSPLLWGFL